MNTENNCCVSKYNWPLFTVLILAFIAVFLAVKDIIPKRVDRVVTFSATSKVLIKPDIAQLRVGVIIQPQATAAQAIKLGNEQMNKVNEAIKKVGIKAEDLQTSVYNLNPQYTYSDNGERKLIGYELYQELLVKVRDLNKVSDVLSAATTAGSNQVGDIQFVVDDLEKAKTSARDRAIKLAKEKARNLAKITGMRLGRIVDVMEGSNDNQPRPLYDYGIGGAGEMKTAAPTIEVGQNEISVTVSLVYELR